MNNQEQNEIRVYLQSKKLPLALLVEVEDHFCSQIQGLMLEENLSFVHAFEKVKYLWKDELELSWNGSSDLEDKCNLLRKYRKNHWRSFFRLVLKYGIFVFSIIAIVLFLLPLAWKKIALNIILITAFLLPFIHYVYHWKTFRLARKSGVNFSFYQEFMSLLGSFSGGSVYIVFSIVRSESVFFIWGDFALTHLLILLVIGILITASIGMLIAQLKHLESIRKLSDYQ